MLPYNYRKLYTNLMVYDYIRWLSSYKYGREVPDLEEKVKKYRDSIKFIKGKKYIKVVRDGSAHSFIQMYKDEKFPSGAVFKAASWAQPSKKRALANIVTMENLHRISWTSIS